MNVNVNVSFGGLFQESVVVLWDFFKFHVADDHFSIFPSCVHDSFTV